MNERIAGIGARYIAVLACAAGVLAGQPATAPEATPGRVGSERVRIPGTAVVLETVQAPAGTVEISAATIEIGELAVSTTEITWDLYDVYLFGLDLPEEGDDVDGVSRPSKPYVPPDRGYGHAGFPAIGMTRHGAAEFCRWLSVKTGEAYRLPTRGEWAYLARADGLPAGVWHEGNSEYTTHAVGKRTPNAWGLHDTLGSVAEWIAPETVIGPDGEASTTRPTAAGGSFIDPLDACTPTATQVQKSGWNASDPQIPKSRWWLADCDFVGFRVVRDLAPSPDTNTDEE